MREAGYGAKARLALDLAVVSFANRFEALRQETVERPAPERKKARATVRVPKYSEAELLEMLGVGQETGGGGSRTTGFVPNPTEADWDALWGDGE